jgi:glycolate oxidase FAD binding subunit
MTAIAPLLSGHLTPHTLVPWEALDAPLQRQIQAATVSDQGVECVVYPETQAELAAVMQIAHAQRWTVLPLGNGQQLHWGGLVPKLDLAISTARLNRLIAHAVGDLTVTAEAGLPLAQLQSILADHQQWLPVSPTYPDTVTLGGLVATADTGALRQRYGGIRDLLIGLTLVRADGGIAHGGGRVVKNVAGYDLMKLFTGSYGTLGIISEVTFRLYPKPPHSETLVLVGPPEAIAQTTQTLRASALTPTAIELLSSDTVDALNLGLGNGMGLLVRFQTIPISIQQQTAQLLAWAQAAGLKGDRHTETAETQLWQQLQAQLSRADLPDAITCKFGVLPAQGAIALDKISHLLAPLAAGVLHANSGLGTLRLSATTRSSEALLTVRQLCQTHGGFLTLLEAPKDLKQTLDTWGYSGNALDAMRRIKQQFDPHHCLSPGRFLPGL